MASRKFYEEILGFKPNGYYEPTKWQSFECGDNMFFALGEAPGSMDETTFEVDGIEEYWERIKAKVEVVFPLEKTPWGSYRFVIKDIDGNILAFREKDH